MDFDGIAREWANSKSLTSPVILTALVDYDVQQLGQLRVSVAQYGHLAHAIDLIDVLSTFQLARMRLTDAKRAALHMADVANQLVRHAAGVPDLAQASVRQAVDAQEAAHLALDKAQSGRERVHAAVVLELADAAASKAREAADAADKLTLALNNLVRTTHATNPVDGLQALDRLARGDLQ